MKYTNNYFLSENMAIFVEIVYLKAHILYFEDIYKFFILLFLYSHTI